MQQKWSVPPLDYCTSAKILNSADEKLLLPNRMGPWHVTSSDRAHDTIQESPYQHGDLLHMRLAFKVEINLKIYVQLSPNDQTNLA